jgi:radical SAM protein with 4Fe4S-binding SPASM domain
MSKAQNLELRRMIKSLRTNGHNIRTGSPYNFLMVNQEVCCPSGIDRLIVGPDLRIYPCDAFKQVKAEGLVGTLDYSTLDGRSLRECWDRSPFLEAVRKYLTTPFADECASCRALEWCASGCLAQKVLASGDMRKQPDPDCIRR